MRCACFVSDRLAGAWGEWRMRSLITATRPNGPPVT
jgi:hypothetical protein